MQGVLGTFLALFFTSIMACRFDLPPEVIFGEECGSAGRCRPPTPVCDEEEMSCVECTKDSECAVLRPICSAGQNCVQCERHADCADSELCLRDGSCAAPDDVAYVGGTSPMPTGNAMCWRAMPCETLQQALAVVPARGIVRISGLAADSGLAIIDDRTVDIYGVDNAVLQRTMAGGVLEIEQGSKVNLFDLEISSANPDGDGVVIRNPPGPMVAMERVKVLNHRGAGIVMTHGSLFVRDSMILGNDEDGIRATGRSLQLARSKILGNRGVAGVVTAALESVLIESSIIAGNQGSSGGVSMKTTGTATIRNSIIAQNGVAGQAVGGIEISASAGVIEFSTIADNTAINGLGVNCTGGTRLIGNIFSDNGVLSSCPISYSLGDTSFLGTENKVGPADFLDMTDPMSPRYFRIGAGSTARDVGDPGANLAVDIDGEPRDDARKDMGADEYRPAP